MEVHAGCYKIWLIGLSHFGAAETSAQICGRLVAVFSQQRFLEFHSHKVFCLSHSSLLHWEDLLHHHMACIIWITQYTYIQSIWPQIVKHNRSTWRRPLTELRDAPLGGCCAETMYLKGREPTIHAQPHLLPLPKWLREKEGFWLEERTNRVRRYDTTRQWGCTQFGGSKKSCKRRE